MKKIFTFFLMLGPTILWAQAQQPVRYIDKSTMNLSVKPGDDFNEYANGMWLKNNPIPAKETRWGSFNQLRDFNSNAIKTILEKSQEHKNHYQKGTVEKRVADFYAAAMDSIAIEKLGYEPIKSDLEKIKAITSKNEIYQKIPSFKVQGLGSPFYGFYVGQDRKNINTMAPQLSQGGTSLPDRDYYLKSDARSLKIQEALKNYIKTLFSLTGNTNEEALKNAEIIFGIEKKLAQAQMSRLEMRDPYKTYNKFAWADFQKSTPGLDWSNQFEILGVSKPDSILVTAPKFFTELSKVIDETSLEDLKVYLSWNILKNSASYLSSPFTQASFAYSQVLTGQKIQRPRWQRMSALTDDLIGELLGQLYVKEYFKPEAKARMVELVANLQKAFEIRIKNLDWMSDETKQKALDKLHAFTPKIGYPDKWKTYDGLEISDLSFYQNIKNASQWAYKENISQLGKPVDRTKWGMTPPTVNAYYSPVMNEIVFPAGILQFPFFDANADDAINYGGIGAAIGHEMSHGFDDSGSQYDKDGSLRNWWGKEDLEKFKAKTALLVAQFDGYVVLDSIHVNGKLTVGENIGDLGGLNVAYEAFKMTKQGKSKKKIDGFTPDQRFFLSCARVWRSNSRPETTAQLVQTDPHSPDQFRAIGAPVNMNAWYKAFKVKPGDKLYKKPEDRIKIW